MIHKCPLCNGSGKIEVEVKPSKTSLNNTAKRLRKEGFTIRQIMTLLGFKHPGSISHLLK